MRPAWLSVPAAHRSRRDDPYSVDDQDGHQARSGSLLAPASVDLATRRAPAPVGRDRAKSEVPGTRVLIVRVDPEAGAGSFSAEDRTRNAMRDLPPGSPGRNDSEEETDVDIEILLLRAGVARRSDGLAPGCRWICSGDTPCCSSHRLDKHRLDVALSAGRHAAERAKLAGVGRLICVAPSVCPATPRTFPAMAAAGRYVAHQCPRLGGCLPDVPACFDPYDALGCRGLPEIAALVGVAIAAAQMGIHLCLPDPSGGVAIAAAQMGIPLCLPDPSGRDAADAAIRLNGGVRAWLDPFPPDIPASARSRTIPRRLCATLDRPSEG